MPAAAPLIAKRLFDIAGSATGLVFSSPLLLAAAIAIRLDSPGPIMFRQQRVGRGGRIFRIHKLRTMRIEGSGPLVSSSDDPRITRVGAVLRRTKLDELPQLLDVLTGEMSLVGPRPEVAEYVGHWPASAQEIILSVRPGITDPASIAFRNESDELARAVNAQEYYVTCLLPRKVALYLDYVQNRTFAGDIRIIFDTVRAVIRE